MNFERLKKQLDFIVEIDKEKNILRQTTKGRKMMQSTLAYGNNDLSA